MASTGKASGDKDKEFVYDAAGVEAAAKAKPWMQDPKFFTTVRISGTAAAKMAMHAKEGVDKGMARGGMPVEVMGLMLGRVDTENERTLLVTDAFALPVEGTETQVMTENEEVMKYFGELPDIIAKTRKDRFMGWYHSHPFDVDVRSHCFLSATDVSTQLFWQKYEDRAGYPFLAVVVDPLRSVAKGKPELGAFRVYDEHRPPQQECPDGTMVADPNVRQERWGACSDRYYQLDVEYFTSSLGGKMLGVLAHNFLWQRTLATTPSLEPENRDRFADRISTLAGELKDARGKLSVPSIGFATPGNESVLDKSTRKSTEIAVEHVCGQAGQLMKQAVFNIGITGLVKPTAAAAAASGQPQPTAAAAAAVVAGAGAGAGTAAGAGMSTGAAAPGGDGDIDMA